MSFFHVLLPKVIFLEQLGALGHLAPKLMLVLLLHKFEELLFDSFVHRSPPKLANLGRLGVEVIVELVFKSFDPVVRPLELLVTLAHATMLFVCVNNLATLQDRFIDGVIPLLLGEGLAMRAASDDTYIVILGYFEA